MPSSIRLLRRWGVTYRTRRQWKPNHGPSRNRYRPPGRYLFLHISVTSKSGSKADRMRTIERIAVDRGFTNTRFSYNACVFEDGDIYQGQPLRGKGAHTINDKDVGGYPYDLNAYGEAICLPQMESDPVTDAQVESIAAWAAAKVLSGESTAHRVEPHNRFAWKACPGAKADARLAEINRLMDRYVKAGKKPKAPKLTGPPVNRARVNRVLKNPNDEFGETAKKQLNLLVDALRARGWAVDGWTKKQKDPQDIVRALTRFQDKQKGLKPNGLLTRKTARRLGMKSYWNPLPAWG